MGDRWEGYRKQFAEMVNISSLSITVPASDLAELLRRHDEFASAVARIDATGQDFTSADGHALCKEIAANALKVMRALEFHARHQKDRPHDDQA